jgi:hypothetical protein
MGTATGYLGMTERARKRTDGEVTVQFDCNEKFETKELEKEKGKQLGCFLISHESLWIG